MTDLKLPQLPDRNPVKLSIAVMPDVHQALIDYATLYAMTYGRHEPVAELIQSGELETVKVGRSTLIPYKSLKAVTGA